MNTLYKYQQDIVDSGSRKMGLFLQTGLGKSAVSIFLKKKFVPNGGALVVTTKSLKKNWLNEISLWDQDGEYIVMSKEEFRRDHKSIPALKAFIFDEGHNAAYPTNQIHKASSWYIENRKPECVWIATANPILSDVTSVWGISKLLGMPIGTYWSFKNKYFIQIPMGFRKIFIQKKGIEEAISADLKALGVVLSKEECLDLPEAVHECEYFDMTSEQKRAIKALDEDPSTSAPIVYHTKCLQIASGTIKKQDAVEFIRCEKLARLKELVSIEPKCVIIAKHIAELEMIRDSIPNVRIFSGSTSIEDRDDIIRSANSGQCVMALQASMGIGFNLVGVSMMIFYSHDYDYVRYSQCLGRIHRIGQKNRCTYVHLITEGTLDSEVWKCLERKEDFDIALYGKR